MLFFFKGGLDVANDFNQALVFDFDFRFFDFRFSH